MPAKVLTTEFGHSMPPEGPHTVTFHVPGWTTILGIRDGDQALFARLTSMYPRFAPWGLCRQLAMALGKKLGLPPDNAVQFWVAPDALEMAKAYGTSEHRKQMRLAESDLTFKAVEVGGIRLFVVAYHVSKSPSMGGAWQNPGLGVSTRLAEFLLPQVESAATVEIPADSSPSWLPETEAHQALRERISELVHRAAIDPDAVKVAARDVFLYPTGMAAIYRAHQCLQERKPGLVLALGSIFHNTYHLFHEAPCGMQHFGQVNAASNIMEEIEAWLDKDKKAVSYCFVEFPSNPLLVSVDLKRLRQIADKYDFALAVDDTVGSFANIDVSSVADVLVSSTTKSFSGYADAMGGSAVLYGSSPRYDALSTVFHKNFRNEVFAADAAHLVANSKDYLARTAVLNRNAAAVAAVLAARPAPAGASTPVVTGVLYPPYRDTYHFLTPFLRRPDADLPASGSGCLLSVDLASLDAARAFYDALQFHKGPHLGAHRALAIPFNELVYWKDPEEGKYHEAYGLRREQVRISVGLEDEAELVACVEEALDAADKVWAEEGKGGE